MSTIIFVSSDGRTIPVVSAYWLATLKRIPMLLVRRSMIAAP